MYYNCSVRIRTRNSKKQIPEDYLSHYGIPGQVWGKRRYQNPDGTLTEEGKLRYRDNPESETWKRNEAEYLTDDELRRRNNRLNAERQYRDLTTSQVERERNNLKKDIINKVLIGTAVSLSVVAMRGHWKKAASFIGKMGKRAIAKLRVGAKMKSAFKTSSEMGKYTHVHGSRGMLNTAGERLNRVSRQYNYRPRANNSIPRSQYWPKSPIDTLGKVVRKVRT